MPDHYSVRPPRRQVITVRRCPGGWLAQIASYNVRNFRTGVEVLPGPYPTATAAIDAGTEAATPIPQPPPEPELCGDLHFFGSPDSGKWRACEGRKGHKSRHHAMYRGKRLRWRGRDHIGRPKGVKDSGPRKRRKHKRRNARA